MATSSQPADFRAQKLVANYYYDWRRQPQPGGVMWGDRWSDGLEMILLGNLSVASPGGGASSRRVRNDSRTKTGVHGELESMT